MPFPLTCQFALVPGAVLVKYERQPNFDDWRSAMDAIFSDSRFDPNLGIILDRTQLSAAPSMEYIGQQARYIDAKNEKFSDLRWAVVAPTDASFGVGRMSEQMVRPNSMRTFYNLKEAVEWLSAR
jgi:hypothetical protein